jgi:hypothetical protein
MNGIGVAIFAIPHPMAAKIPTPIATGRREPYQGSLQILKLPKMADLIAGEMKCGAKE